MNKITGGKRSHSFKRMMDPSKQNAAKAASKWLNNKSLRLIDIFDPAMSDCYNPCNLRPNKFKCD